MGRLINGDELIWRLHHEDLVYPYNVIMEERIKKKVTSIVRSLPEVKKEDVIHCKDCEWWTKQDKSSQGRCELMQMYPTGEWFCGNAQKRVEDGRKNQG